MAEEQLHLFHIGFSATHITSMVGVSVHTIRRRMDDIGLQVSDLYSTLSDNELDIIINEILIQFPNTGYGMMAGHLKRQGVQVQQYRIHESHHCISPASIATRCSTSITRRVYSVIAPLSLWHIDRCHKMIR